MPSPGLLVNPYRPPALLPRLEAPALTLDAAAPLAAGAPSPSFGEVLSDFVRQTDAAQHRADDMVEALALGEPVDVHQVMLALNEASNAVQLALQVRTKVLEAYQELMRTPL